MAQKPKALKLKSLEQIKQEFAQGKVRVEIHDSKGCRVTYPVIPDSEGVRCGCEDYPCCGH